MRHPLRLCFLAAALAALHLAAAPATQAKIWRVDNNGGSPGDFTTAQAAHDGASAGDTLYFNGSGTSYGSLTMSKRLYVFGPGYFLAQNPETQANTSAAILGTLQLEATADGSLLTGLEMSRAYLYASNLLFKRNHVSLSTPDFIVQVGDGSRVPSNVLLVQNYIENNYPYGYSAYGALHVYAGCSNVLVSNNYLYFANSYSTGGRAIWAEPSISFSQNVLHGDLVTNNTNVVNNYLFGGSLGGSSNSYANNIGDGTQFPTGSGNQQNQPVATVFQSAGSPDGQYQLAAASPASGAGQNGEDVGLFGGNDPYVLSGLPAIPAIWFFAAPSTGSGASGLQVHLKAKSHN